MEENKDRTQPPLRMTRDERVPDHQSSPGPSSWGRRCPVIKTSSSSLTMSIVAMLVLTACVTMVHLVVQILTLPLDVQPHSSNFNAKSFIPRDGTLIDRIVQGSTGCQHDRGRLRRPWNDAIWVSKVKQSGAPKKAGDLSVLVTGAAGFIGSYASMAMRKKGWGVVGLDNFNDYADPTLKREREANVYKKGRNFIVDGDVNDDMLLNELFEIVPFTHVLHLAAQTGHGFRHRSAHAAHSESPVSYVNSNVAGLVTLLEVCAKAASSQASSNPQRQGQPAIVWASSSSVYGLNTRAPFSELDRTDQPTNLYAATKKAGEEIVHVYNHLYGLSITVLRLFDVYGPWSRPDMDVFRFTKAILDENPITLYAQEAHDLSYIDDIIRGCIAAVETADKSLGFGPSSEAKRRGRRAQLRLFNIGTGVPTRMSEIIRILEKLLDKNATKVIQLQEMDGLSHMYAVANLSLAETHLGYSPHTDLLEGLRKFVAWYYHRHAKAHII